MDERSSQRRLDVVLNREKTEVVCADSDILLDVLRDGFGLTGAKRSCDIEICGACTVLLDGQPVSACATLAYEAGGRRVDTVEGVADDGRLHPLQQAFIEHGALQCGFCTPGMVMTVLSLLDREPHPSRERVVEELEGNLCRCTGYFKIVDAVLAFSRAAGSGAARTGTDQEASL